MSQFNNDIDIENIIGISYNIHILPTHIVESTQFKCWQKLFPEETDYIIKESIFVKDLIIKSQEDFDRIIEADFMLGFSQNTRIDILRNTEKFWNEDPNSAPFQIPKEDYSIFANQIRVLFKENVEVALVSCEKRLY
jgi:hypothetical protein